MFRSLCALLLLAFPPGVALGAPSLVHSRADLLRGVRLERFVDFQAGSHAWSGDGAAEDGAYLLAAPVGGGWVAATTSWEGEGDFALEVEVRRFSGPYEAEYGILLEPRSGGAGIRVLLTNEGRLRVDQVRPGVEEALTPWTVGGRLHSGDWNRIALRVSGGRLSVGAAGEEVLVVDLPPFERGRVGFAAGGEGAFLFDNLALYSEEGMAGGLPSPAGGAIFLESFAVGRGEWDREVFPVRSGALHLAPVEGRREHDLLRFPLPDEGGLDARFWFDGGSPFDLVLPARPEELGLSGLLWRIHAGGLCGLLAKKGAAETALHSDVQAPLFAREGENNLSLRWKGKEVVLLLNGEEMIRAARPDSGDRRVALQSPEEGAVQVDHILLYDARRPAPFDTTAAARLWSEAESLATERAFATRTDRLRDLFLAAPSLPGVLDLLYRDAARAGDSETALAVAEAMLGEVGYGMEQEKLRIMALLLCRRWEPAHAALARFRARHPEDPFAVENILLLLDRTERYGPLLREYAAMKAGGEPLRATAHGVAASAYLQSLMPGQAADALHVAKRLGPGRLDLDLLEGDLLREKGDLAGAADRYEALLRSSTLPVEAERIHARLAVLHFESAQYDQAAGAFALLPAAPDSTVTRARSILRAVSLYQSGIALGGEGGRLLEEAGALVEEKIGDPPTREDALLYDLLGRIRAALAWNDLEEGESYPVYREKMRRARALFAEAAALDPALPRTEVEEGSVPDLDPGLFRALLRRALPDDHPVGGFVEDLRRWPSWYLADRRADLAESRIRSEVGGGRR